MIGRLMTGAVALTVLASSASAVVRTISYSGSSNGFGAAPLFDASLGTLQSVFAQSTYDLAFDYNYGWVTPSGFNGPKTITASLGGATWQMEGQGAISGGPVGVFSLHATGSKTFTAAAELAALTGTTATLTSYSLNPVPLPSAKNVLPTLRYALTYTFDDNVAAVPEPASWVLMIGGFLGVGAVLRARRRTAAAA